MAYATAADGVQLYYEETGQGEPLLLVSGQASDHTGWLPVLEDFATHYRVILFDHRGTGQSDKPAEPAYTTRGFAQDTVAILNHLHIPRAHVYGVSMGGRVCQWLGIDHPERIGALILGCTTPGNAHGVRRPAEVDARMANPPSDPQAAMMAMLEQMFTPAFIAAHGEVFAQMPPSLTPPFAQRLHYQASEGHEAWDLLPIIQAPTLVIHGSDDQVNPTANAPLLAQRISGAELYIVEGARHVYFVEFRQESSRVVNDFLARHPLPH